MQRFVASTIFAMGLAATAAHAQHVHGGDVEVEIEEGRIVTHGARVFEAEFDAGTAATDEPGFDSEAGTFNSGASVTLSLLSDLEAWNGSAFVAPGSVGTNSVAEILHVYQATAASPNNINTLSGPTSLTTTANASGTWHKHFAFTLFPQTGDDPAGLGPDGQDPDAGIYRIALGLSTNQSGVDSSLPFWIVFNYNDSEFNHEAAVDFTNAEVAAVPEPAAMGLAALLAPLVLRRVRRA